MERDKIMIDDKLNYALMGVKLIETAVLLDESLVKILKIGVRRVKELIKSNNYEELHKLIHLLKYIIMVLTITEEKIRIGIDMYGNSMKN